MATTQAYFDARNLTPQPKDQPPRCPVSGCTAALETAPSQWGAMPYCRVHGIRIHAASRSFVYYNGSDVPSKRTAALRNIRFEQEYFDAHIMGSASKAETHRICNERSEDALTWNVFARLAREGVLRELVSNLTSQDLKDEPELYLWGLRVCPGVSSPSPAHSRSVVFPALARARDVFEPDITNYMTEPDIMLYVPGKLLVIMEAKFTSGNPIATGSPEDDVAGKKPTSRAGILRRYHAGALPEGALATDAATDPFYSQLYRNAVFAIHMANQLGVQWALGSLVRQGQPNSKPRTVDFQDPTAFIHTILPKHSHSRFSYYSWERLYADLVAKQTSLDDLAEYMTNKSASCAKAFAV